VDRCHIILSQKNILPDSDFISQRNVKKTIPKIKVFIFIFSLCFPAWQLKQTDKNVQTLVSKTVQRLIL